MSKTCIPNRFEKTLALICVFGLCFLSCGKKEPPRLPLYDKPPEQPVKTGRDAGLMQSPSEETIPSAPAGIEAFATEDRVVVFWNESPEIRVKGYEVFRSDGGGEFKRVGTSQTPAFVDMGKVVSKRTYKIRAFSDDKESPFSEPVTVNPK